MKILIDTHILLWMLRDDSRLTREHREQLQNAEQVFVSHVSLWECVIKMNIGKLKMDIEKMIASLSRFGLEILPLRLNHIQTLVHLPLKHRDPFDRMLIAQAKSEPLILITDDKHIQGYF